MRRAMKPVHVALLSFLVVIGLAPIPAAADNPPPPEGPCASSNGWTADCDVSAGGTTSSPTESGDDAAPPPRKCYAPSGGEISCQTKDGYWSSVYHCYIKPYDGPDTEQLRAKLNATDDQILVTCTPAPGDTGANQQVILTMASEATPPPDPRTIAWQLVAEVNLRAGQIGLVPTSEHAMVGLPTWMWVDDPGPHTTGPISQSTTVRGYTITIEAELSKIVYDMGDGTTVTCAGTDAAGTEYHERYGTEPSPTCGHFYDQPGDYTITARSVWTVNWYGVGQAGVLTISVQRSINLTVLEGHTVIR